MRISDWSSDVCSSDLVERSWRLNERHYGVLQGHNRAKMALQHGNDSVAQWRRSFTAEPPALADGDPRLPALDPLYAGVAPALLPRSESLQQAAARVRSEEHTSELQSLMRISYAVFCLKKKKKLQLTIENLVSSIHTS